VHVPGDNDINTKVGSIRDVGDSTSSISDTPCTADTHRIYDPDRDKIAFSPSDPVPPHRLCASHP